MAVSDRDTLMSAIFERMKEDSVLRDIATKPFFGAGGPVGTVPYESTANISATHSAERVVTAETILRIKELAEAGSAHFDRHIDPYKYAFPDGDTWIKSAWENPTEATITPEREPVKTERQQFYEDQEDAGAF